MDSLKCQSNTLEAVNVPVAFESIKTINKTTTLASDVRSRAAMETGRPIPATDDDKGHKEQCKNSWQEDTPNFISIY